MSSNRSSRERGSATILTIFALVLLTGMGVAFLYMSHSDVKVNQAGQRATKAFYLAEAGLEDARTQLAATNVSSVDPNSLTDELATADGANNALNFNADTLTPTFDSSGNVTGFTGYGDDVPLRGLTSFAGGWYAAFLTNDPLETGGKLDPTDTNDRGMITSIGVGSDRSVEVVQAIVEKQTLPGLPATITAMGPTPSMFDGGSSGAKFYEGDDCAGATGYTGIPGYSVPVVGTVGTASETYAAGQVDGTSATWESDGHSGDEVVDDLTSTADPIWTQTIDPLWRDCAYLKSLGTIIKNAADYVCTTPTGCTHWASSTISTVTYVEGDLDLGPVTGKGILWVTGQCHMRGGTNWDGVIFVVGTGDFLRDGGGNGHTYGATFIADISGPDGIFGNSDDCTGPGPDPGFSSISFETSGGGTHDTIYCSSAIQMALNGLPFDVMDFRQR